MRNKPSSLTTQQKVNYTLIYSLFTFCRDRSHVLCVTNAESTKGEHPSYSDDTNIESQIFKYCITGTFYSGITPVSEDEVTSIEQKTREQANCAEWMKARKGKY